MKKITFTLAAAALVGLYASNASAQCAFNTVPAKGVSGSLIRNYAPCPGTEHPSANTATEGGTDACTPVIPAGVDGDSTLYSFSAKGKCSFKASAKLESDCSAVEGGDGSLLGLESKPCHVTYVSSKCSGILGTDGVTPIGASDDGFSLATLSRATVDDATNGDMTIIDFPVTFLYSTPSRGGMEIASSSAEALVPLVGVNNADLPACTQIEIVNVVVKDPAGLPFAKLGGGTKPK